MPIKMTGSVKPTSLTSPDPVSMPIVQKLPALKANIEELIEFGPSGPPHVGQLINTDWLAPSDGLGVLDPVSGLEWLQLSYTDNIPLNTIESQLGSTYAGWRMPTQAEIATLLLNVFGPLAYNASHYYPHAGDAATIANVARWRTAFGQTRPSGDSSLGWAKSDTGSAMYVGTNSSYVYSTDYVSGFSTSVFSTGNDRAGVFLVNDGGVTLTSIADPTINIPAV